MTYPILYEPGATDFENNGLGMLSDAVKCTVTEELGSGIFELNLQYPVTGIHFGDIKNRSIIKVQLQNVVDAQLFVVYEITKPITGIVSISAAHISYSAQYIPVQPFSATSAADAMNGLKNNAVIDCPFTLTTDKTTTGEFKVTNPKSLLACLRGEAGSIVDTYGGEFQIDNYDLKLVNRVGVDRGVIIRYGKNLTNLKQEQSCANVYSGVYPYWVDYDSGEAYQLPEKIVRADQPLPFDRIKTVDMTAYFSEKPSEEQLRARATAYINDNQIWKPRVNLTVSYVQLEQTDEYRGSDLLERVYLGDTVSVEFPALGVSSTARATRITWDVLTARIDKVHLGAVKRSITDTLLDQQTSIDRIESPSFIQGAVDNATKWITNGAGYMVAVKDLNGNWKELCSLDTPDINTATNVWRWNNAGFGHSSTGYNGPYGTAITQDGAIVADFITSGTMQAGLIKTGVLESNDPNHNFHLNLDTGVLKGNFSDLQITGKTVDEITDAKVGDLSDSVNSKFELVNNEISAKVSHSGGDASSFGWYLNTDGFFIDANGSTIISATQNGLRIEGQIEALSGHIGNWDIGADGTINAKSSDGLYTFIAPPGTAGMGGNVILAGGNGETAYPFKVGSDGSLVATKATITGDIYGNNGYFHGTVRAGKIEYSGDAGYFSGAGLSGTSVSNGKLSTTVSDNIAKGVEASDITSGKVSAISMSSNSFKTSTLHIGSHLVIRIPTKLKNPATGQIEDYMVLATHGTT